MLSFCCVLCVLLRDLFSLKKKRTKFDDVCQHCARSFLFYPYKYAVSSV